MSYDDPNREAVGVAPIWSGAGEGAPEGETFDPGEHTVQDVLAHVERHPDDRDAIVVAERAGKGRKSILDALEAADA